jgi:hypothetical protein
VVGTGVADPDGVPTTLDVDDGPPPSDPDSHAATTGAATRAAPRPIRAEKRRSGTVRRPCACVVAAGPGVVVIAVLLVGVCGGVSLGLHRGNAAPP